MASHPPFLLLLLFLFTLSSLLNPRSRAAKLPFHPEDILPLLPRQLSWPILNSLRRPVDLLPTFVGAASASNGSLDWKGACFYENTAWMEFHNKTGSEFGGGTLHIKFRLLAFALLWLGLCLVLSAVLEDFVGGFELVVADHELLRFSGRL